MPRIIHAADIHLDSPLQGLGRIGDASVASAHKGIACRGRPGPERGMSGTAGL